jgi:hypothetical protein
VVHEWGTDTVVVGSDGSLQRGLQHEEEDLPAFVYDRIKAGSLPGATSVHVKMETPVTYFYSDAPLAAKVSVAFPQGIFTQWYPAVHEFYPFVAAPGAVAGLSGYADPALDIDFPFASQACSDKHGAVASGLLDWGAVQVLARGEAPSLPDAPLSAFTWSYARDVDANAVRIAAAPGAAAPESERFLFYRGLGNFDMPVRIEAAPGGAILATNLLDQPIGAVFLLNVGTTSGAFKALPEGIAPGGALAETAPPLAGAETLDGFVASLGDAVTDALDATGLYHDEAEAMVATWKRQWFRTPGVRLLYLAPQPWTETSIPLVIEPAPEEMVRVMMIRVEVITPELEAADVEQAQKLGNPAVADQAEGYFRALGRFAEPRLRRALALLGDPAYAAPLLAEIETAETSSAAGE